MSEQHIARNLPHLIDLARRADEQFEGVDVSVVDGVVMMSPVAPAHYRTQHEITRQLSDQVGDMVLGEIEFTHPAWSRTRSPDVVVWHGDDQDESPYDAEEIALAVEIVSPSSVENDYVIKPRAYGLVGIPAALVLDPYTRAWTIMTGPSSYGYAERHTGPYGKLLDIDCGQLTVHVNTEGLPVAKQWQLRDAWPAHRLDPSTVE
ncbi:Uma2 family endonuclease [Streptomyces ipomoeae]|uniref:Uma2 family endonuclease n=1 Tax=Streptomyces ipomoeae TaxID=103232 RepID=UPI001146324E|nr:Uma2 family endonuclease [Streptomyces ipomoeae]TQE35660.1 Uma2 family endonuclease [Streptomyces ipomoeae]